MPHPLKVITFDLDTASLIALQEALPEWEIEVFKGATADSLTQDWNPGAADLLVIQAGAEPAETIGLCRFLAFCGSFSADSRELGAETLGQQAGRPNPRPRADAPLLVLVASEKDAFVSAVLEAGADSCLVLPVHAKELVSMLARVRQGNRPGHHTLNLDPAQREDRWRDNGGQG